MRAPAGSVLVIDLKQPLFLRSIGINLHVEEVGLGAGRMMQKIVPFTAMKTIKYPATFWHCVNSSFTIPSGND
jgi:hypothetical protein